MHEQRGNFSVLYQTCRLWRRPCDQRGMIWGPRSRWGGRRGHRTPARSPPAKAGSGAPTWTHAEDSRSKSNLTPFPLAEKYYLNRNPNRRDAPSWTRHAPRSPPWGWGCPRGRWSSRRPRARRRYTAPARAERRGGRGQDRSFNKVPEGAASSAACLPGTWGRHRRCRWIRPAFSLALRIRAATPLIARPETETGRHRAEQASRLPHSFRRSKIRFGAEKAYSSALRV